MSTPYNTYTGQQGSDNWCPKIKNFAEQEGFRDISYGASFSGTQHQPCWEAVCYLDGIEWGRGQGSTKNKAKSRAAHVAYNHLDMKVNGS
ncbi:hypothetical protein DL96DRAFT_1703645 [Flagelloscypha sp. PMI_526]|nr:hypothetical protein DL96DRAFT_1703645 [Flagelloscypha sp. PMI_526]